jgi:hypothetical protein
MICSAPPRKEILKPSKKNLPLAKEREKHIKKRNPAAPTLPGQAGQVPSAQGVLTSVFGKGTGVSHPPSPPEIQKSWQERPFWASGDESSAACGGGKKRAFLSGAANPGCPRSHPPRGKSGCKKKTCKKPHGLLVPLGSTHCCAYTCGLSTSWSPTALEGAFAPRDLILGVASRLDAFSVSPFRTWLPGDAAGATAGTPGVRPSRSSRTKDRFPQVSCAHTG